MLDRLGKSTHAAEARDDVDRLIKVVPDPSVLKAIGRGHSIETALADTIDNSIDFGAHRVLVRFQTSDSLVTAIEIHDDGAGMDASALEAAMTLGKQRAYGPNDLGHFGMGLKASAMSQGRVLTVHSSRAQGEATAMRLRRDTGKDAFEAEVLTERSVRPSLTSTTTGTIVVWSELETVSQASAPAERREWLEVAIDRVQKHLGLIMHRLIQKRGLEIEIEVSDELYGESGAPRGVEPIDPFNFTLWGKTGYPRTLLGETTSGAEVRAKCHILPPNSKSPSARIQGRDRRDWQGIYVYRNDRLLHAGGWLTLRSDGKSESQLARVAIDATPALEGSITINPEKHDVRFQQDIITAIEQAEDGTGNTWGSFLADAATVLIDSNKRDTGARPVKPVGAGLPNSIRELFTDALRVDERMQPATFGWKLLGEGRLFTIDPAAGRVWLNAGYRRAFSTDPSDPDDAAFLKLSVFFAIESWLGRNLRLVNLDQVKGIDRVMADALFDGRSSIDYDPFGEEWDPTTGAAPIAHELDLQGPLGAVDSEESERDAHLADLSPARRREILEEAALAYDTCVSASASQSDLDYAVRMLAGHGVWSMSQIGVLTGAPASFIRARMSKADKTGGAFSPQTIDDLIALIDLDERDSTDPYLTKRIVDGGTRVTMISRLTGRSEQSLTQELNALSRIAR